MAAAAPFREMAGWSRVEVEACQLPRQPRTFAAVAPPPGLDPPVPAAAAAATGAPRRAAARPLLAAAARGGPKERNSKHSATYTTVMLCNMNLKDDTLEVVRRLQVTGWEDTFDFCHKPRQSNQAGCKPYAFVNFKTHELAERFRADAGHGFQVEVADVQGLDANCKGWARSNFREGGKVKSNGIHDRRLWPWVEDAGLWQRYHSRSRNAKMDVAPKEAAAAMPAPPSPVPAASRRTPSGGSTASGSTSSGSQARSDAWGRPSWSSPRGGSPVQAPCRGAGGSSPSWSPRNEVQAFIPFDPLEPARLVMTGFEF